MTYWRMTKKTQKHPAIDPGETVLQASYGLSATFVGAANAAVSAQQSRTIRTAVWNEDMGDGEGLARPLKNTGVLALTSKRLLFFKMMFAIGRPKNLVAQWPLDQIAAIDYSEADKTLMVTFADGSAGGLHSPKNQWPHKLAAAFQELAGG